MQEKQEKFYINDNEYPSTDITFGRYLWYTPDTGYRALSKVKTTVYLGYKSITTNGSYSIINNRIDNMLLGWWKVDVNVPQGEQINNANVTQSNLIVSNGQYNIPSGYTGFNSFEVAVPTEQINNANVNANNLITSNGIFTVPSGYTGFNGFEVAVPITQK